MLPFKSKITLVDSLYILVQRSNSKQTNKLNNSSDIMQFHDNKRTNSLTSFSQTCFPGLLKMIIYSVHSNY